MKPTILLLFALSFFVLFQSCKKEDITQNENAALQSKEIGTLTAFISKTTGVDSAKISYDNSKEEFSIYNDLRMTLSDARQRYEKASSHVQTEQRRADFLLTDVRASNLIIYYLLGENVPADWQSAVTSAVGNWNSLLDVKISMSVNPLLQSTFPQTGRVAIRLYYDASSPTIAYTYTPTSTGNPADAIYINTAFNYLSADEKIWAITHELGHIVGLKHTNESAGTYIPGTPVSDPNSLMNSTLTVVLGGNWFTQGDYTAIHTLYPQ